MRRHRPRFLRVLRVYRRRWLAWVDRRAGALLPLVPSWGASVLLHALLLLILGLLIYTQGRRDRSRDIEGQFATQLTEDLTSLVPSDHAGDPFTTVKSDEPPSLSIEKPRPDETAINQPNLSLSRFAPELAGPEPALPSDLTPTPKDLPKNLALRRVNRSATAKDLGGLNLSLHSEDLTAPFSGRQGPMRARLVRREGGTVHSEKAVDAGLDWLVRHQRVDGGWSLNYHGQCQGGCPAETNLESDTAATGLALLPLLGAGHIHTEKSRYQAVVRNGLEWLTSHQQDSGDLFVGGAVTAHLYSHAIGTMVLCESFGLSNDPKLRRPAQRAIDFIVAAQDPRSGGWRYAPGQFGDTSVFGWQMFALRSARLAGLRVPRNTIKGCRSYLDLAAADDNKVTYSYMPGRGVSPVMTAEALLSRQYLGWPRDFPPLVKGASMVAAHLEESKERNIYYWYYATQLLHNMQNEDWKRWNVRVRDGLVAMQTGGDGCARGSWDPVSPQPDEWASSAGRLAAGRLYLTALSVLTLEVYYRYLPLYQPSDQDKSKLATSNAEETKENAEAAEPSKEKEKTEKAEASKGTPGKKD
jgi:hypothetical protein